MRKGCRIAGMSCGPFSTYHYLSRDRKLFLLPQNSSTGRPKFKVQYAVSHLRAKVHAILYYRLTGICAFGNGGTAVVLRNRLCGRSHHGGTVAPA